MIPRIGKEIQFTPEMLEECNASIPNCRTKAMQRLFTVVQPKRYDSQNEITEEENEWKSPISTRLGKFIHIYDFMPNFPQIHIIRMTFTNGPTVKNQSSRVKDKLEQSLRSEGNMVRLMKSNGSMPKFIS